MNDQQPSGQDVLNLFDLLEVIRKQSLIIVSFTLIALGLGGLVAYSGEKEYETSISFHVYVIPPFLGEAEALADVRQFFERRDLFSKWKENNPGSNFKFEMIDERRIVNGKAFAVDEDGRFILIGKHRIIVRSNDIDLVSDIAEYLRFVSADLTNIYFEQAKKSQSRIDSAFNETELLLNYRNGLSANLDLAKVNRFLFKVNQGLEILKVSRPSMPERKNFRPKMTMAMSLFLGLTVGAIFVLFRNSYRLHKVARLAGVDNKVT